MSSAPSLERDAFIYSVGLASVLGNSFAQCQENYRKGERLFRRNPNVTDHYGHHMTLGEVIPFEKQRDYPQRLRDLCEMTLSDLKKQAPIPRRSILRIMLPHWTKKSSLRSAIETALAQAAQTTHAQFSYGGSAEALSMLGSAAEDIRQGKADSVVIGTLDSFMNADLLDVLSLQDRVFTKGNPYGNFPAEAACFFLLASNQVMRQAQPLGRFLGVFTGREVEDVKAPKGVVGHGLAAVYRSVGQYFGPDRLLADLSGERWRAEEIGFAASAGGPKLADLVADVEAPLLYTGDCGSATGALMAALALCRPPARGHKRDGPMAMVSTSAHSGARAVMVLERFQQQSKEQVR